MSARGIQAYPFNYDWRRRFPRAERVLGAEGGGVYAAEGEGVWWLITDKGTMADFLDPDEYAELLASMVELRRFDDRPAWEAEVAAVRARQARPRGTR